MPESTEILFDTILRTGKVEFTELREHKHVLYFKANGHQFCCVNGRIYHEQSPMYGCSVLEIWAKQENDPKEIVKKEERDKEFDDEWNGWLEFEDQVKEKVFAKMLPHILLNDFKKAEEVYEYYFDAILPGKGAKKMIKKLRADKP